MGAFILGILFVIILIAVSNNVKEKQKEVYDKSFLDGFQKSISKGSEIRTKLQEYNKEELEEAFVELRDYGLVLGQALNTENINDLSPEEANKLRRSVEEIQFLMQQIETVIGMQDNQ